MTRFKQITSSSGIDATVLTGLPPTHGKTKSGWVFLELKTSEIPISPEELNGIFQSRASSTFSIGMPQINNYFDILIYHFNFEASSSLKIDEIIILIVII